MNFSRPGGEVIAQYYNFIRLGKEGYRKVQGACAEVGQYFAGEIAKLGVFDILYDGQGGIPGACWTLKPGANGFTLYDLADRLRSRGWLVPAYSLPPERSDLVVQRIVVRHGVSRDLASLLIEDSKQALDYFKKHPIQTPLSEAEAGGHNHTGRHNLK